MPTRSGLVPFVLVTGVLAAFGVAGRSALTAQGTPLAEVTIEAADCTLARVGTSVPVSSIGEPVGDVVLSSATWVASTDAAPAHCRVDGSMAPSTPGPAGRSINFRVLLPARWTARAAQLGGGGINGVIPNLLGNAGSITGPTPLQRGFATYGSDSGHQAGGLGGGAGRGAGAPGAGRGIGSPTGPGAGRGPGGPGAGGPPGASAAVPAGAGTRGAGQAPAGAPGANEWALDDEAMKNLGHLQMKKTHDAAFVVIERMYRARPRFTYYLGTSQGGREALTVAQRYAADYDGIVANVPIVSFSTLMLAPELIRIQEKPLANWVTAAKVNAIRGEFMRQCDTLDGLGDGVINNYMSCRAIFDVTQGTPNRHPWAAKRCVGNVDPNPADTSAGACLTDGQIATLELVYSRYRFTTPLASGTRSFGMWVPNTDPSGSGLIAPIRYRGQEGAAAEAPLHSHLGILGVTGFLMQNLAANPLDYVEGGALDARRVAISAALDSTNPDLSAFERRGGKALVTIGTNDTLASPGAQLDYYQSVLDTMGRSRVDGFMRLFVIPQANHGLAGSASATTGDGQSVDPAPIPNTYDRLGLLLDWVERGIAPGTTLTVTAGDRSLPLCSYPAYPRYVGGPVQTSTSYTCAQP